jgi:hypothetical protein
MIDLFHVLRLQWDRVTAVAAIVIGAVALFLGWLGASGTSHPAEQIPYLISGGMTGIFLLGVGVMLWLSADLRDTWRKLEELTPEEPVVEQPETEAATVRPLVRASARAR